MLADGVKILPGFNLVFLLNDGVSFGLLGGLPWWGLSLIALAICGWLGAVMVRTDSKIETAGCGLIIGGALGNVSDRLRQGAVTDFLDFYVDTVHWPAFNFADTFVFCGVALLLWAQAQESQRRKRVP